MIVLLKNQLYTFLDNDSYIIIEIVKFEIVEYFSYAKTSNLYNDYLEVQFQETHNNFIQ